jgi:guanylate kinase
MKLINIGFGNLVNSDKLIAVVAPDAAPVKRIVQDAKSKGMLVDATCGRKCKAVLVTTTLCCPPSPQRLFITEQLKARNKRMNSKSKGKLVLYTGSSGVGKGTIMAELLKRNPNIRLSVSNTTRKPRKGEIDGVHYNFVTKEQFEKLIEENGFLEYAKYCDNYYGTPKKQVEDLLNQGYDVFLEIEVQGGLQILEKYPDVLSIFILPTSIDSLSRRLHRRGTEDEKTIAKRLAEAEHEMSFKNRYKYNVVNDDLDTAVNEVLDILEKESK